MIEAVQTVLRKYAVFSGRASRSEYWWWILFVVIVSIVSQIIDGAVVAPALGFQAFEEGAGQPLSMLVSLALLLPGLGVAVRRLHDIDHSGWWFLLILVPIVGFLILLYWFVQPGTKGDNQYGEAPLQYAS
ncbi:DUF805 domain-containing protein [Roseibium sp.]|uniref:DUF805 domain-containing protein n=1 Tax=Roseibium sp. TaxID=1936156 RepID=UPI003BAAD364